MEKNTVLIIMVGFWLLMAFPVYGFDGATPYVREVRLKFPSRDSGYSIGDVIIIEAFVTAATDFTLDRRDMAMARTRVHPWLERVIEVTFDRMGTYTGYSLRFTYQIFFVTDEQQALEIPEYPLIFVKGEESFRVVVSSFPFSLSPLVGKDWERLEFMPDVIPRPPRVAYVAAGSGALFVLGMWLLIFVAGGRIRNAFVRRRHSPFRRALRLLRDVKDAYAAFRLAHQAINAYSGKAFFLSRLDFFMTEHAGFAAYRPDLEEFFARSNRLFFGREDERIGEGWCTDEGARIYLVALLEKLSFAERSERSGV